MGEEKNHVSLAWSTFKEGANRWLVGWERTHRDRQLLWPSWLRPTHVKGTCLWVLPSEVCSKLPTTLVYIPHTSMHSLTLQSEQHIHPPQPIVWVTHPHQHRAYIKDLCAPDRYTPIALSLCVLKHPSRHLACLQVHSLDHPHNPVFT